MIEKLNNSFEANQTELIMSDSDLAEGHWQVGGRKGGWAVSEGAGEIALFWIFIQSREIVLFSYSEKLLICASDFQPVGQHRVRIFGF